MALTEVNFCLCDTGSQPHLDCVLHRVDKFYRWVQSDTVFLALARKGYELSQYLLSCSMNLSFGSLSQSP